MFVILIGWVGLCFGCYWLAEIRGRSGFVWFLVAFLTSPLLAFIILVIIADLTRDPSRLGAHHQQQLIAERKIKRCPDCAETVLYAANVCKHCGHRFESAAETKRV